MLSNSDRNLNKAKQKKNSQKVKKLFMVAHGYRFHADQMTGPHRKKRSNMLLQYIICDTMVLYD